MKPTTWVICPRCEGEGKHMTPSMLNHAYTQEEIEQEGGQEFIEEMLSGMYDVTCNLCHGRRVMDAETVQEEHQALKDMEHEAEMGY